MRQEMMDSFNDINARFTAKACHRKSFTKSIAKFPSKGLFLSQGLPCKTFTKLIAKFRCKGLILSKDTSPQTFHKLNCKVWKQRPVLVIGHVTAKVSQSQLPVLVIGHVTAKVSQRQLQSFAAKARSCHRARHCKSFTTLIAKFRSKGLFLSQGTSLQKFHKVYC